MKAKYSSGERIAILLEFLEKKRPVSQICKDCGISRTLFYRWLQRYQDAEAGREKESLVAKKRVALHYPSAVPGWVERKILKVVREYPEYSVDQILRKLPKRVKVGRHGVQRVLERFDLSNWQKRVRFANRRSKALPALREKMIKRVVEGEESVAAVCQDYGISRQSFYTWLRRYQERGIDGLWDKPPDSGPHPRQASEEQEQAVRDVVLADPSLSVSRIVARLPKLHGRPILGHHGVQNVLVRNGLNMFEMRLAYAKQRAAAPISVRPATGWVNRLRLAVQEFLPSRAPAPPPSFVQLASRFRPSLTQIKRFSPYIFLLFLFLLGFYTWGRLLGSATTASQAIGWIFASTALSMGSVFFLYSVKYYFTLAVVLSFSREASDQSESVQTYINGSWLSRLFGFRIDARQAGPSTSIRTSGLEPDLSQVKLERQPFISIHLPMYNEKRVAERILKACTSFDYSNYEIVVADDSTDETTAIIERFVEQWNKSMANDKSLIMTNEGLNGLKPRIKVVHRDTREGFKGGALKEALKHTDPRAEFIVVFDADFVPYPDTLELFLKYFQANVGSLQRVKKQEIRNKKQWKYQDSKIAAIQGYQWHVLNKSENWITRGVRSEYAGSYVIERSGEELYGGLKQIAGSVYMVRRDLVDRFGWGTSLTEDFELTLKLYEAGYKVVYTPYIQAPSECVSTLKRLIRQRMRWAEGHSFNIRRMFLRLMFGKWEEIGTFGNQEIRDRDKDIRLSGVKSLIFRSTESYSRSTDNLIPSRKWIPSPLSLSEKLEFLYLSPYYLQAAFFLLGTISWLFSETIFQTRLPFWTSVWGWSLVLTNLLSLPLMNSVGLFLEEAEEKDFAGTLSFILLSYILVPFQAYASVKGFIEPKEGPWFRTPKTGKITDILTRGRFYRFIRGIFPGSLPSLARKNADLSADSGRFALATANRTFSGFTIRRRKSRLIGRALISVFLITSMMLVQLAGTVMVSSHLPGAGGAFAIGPEEAPLGSESYEGQAEQVILTDNRQDQEEEVPSSRDNLEPAITVEEHSPQTHPEDFYLQDEESNYVPYRLIKEAGSLAVETKSKNGSQRIVFENDSLNIKLSEKVSESIGFVPKAVSTPIFEFLGEQGEWQEYLQIVSARLSTEEHETYVVVTLNVDLFADNLTVLVPASVTLAIGYQGEDYLNKFDFRFGENSNINRLRWQIGIVQSSKLKVQNCEDSREQCGIARDAYDLREPVEPELEEYFRASLLGTPVGKQQFANVEIDWRDFTRSREPEVRSQRLESQEELACPLFPDLSLLPAQYPLRVEQSKEENSNTVYFYPNGKQGALEIDPTIELTTPGSTIQIDVANRYQAIMQIGDTYDYLIFKDRAQNDGSPNEVLKLTGADANDEGIGHLLRYDGSRTTTILENNGTRVRLRVEGCLDTTDGGACLKDTAGGDDDVIRVTEEYTFTIEGVFIHVSYDFKGGLGLDASPGWDAVYSLYALYNEDVSNTHSDTIYYGDGETESTSSSSQNISTSPDDYVVLQGTADYQDIIMGTMDIDGDKILSNSSNGVITHSQSSSDYIMYRDTTAQTISGEGDAQIFIRFHAQGDLDAPAERKGMFNDLTNPDILSYATGDLWDDKPFGDFIFSSSFEGADSNLCDGGDGWSSGICESGNTAIGDDSSTVYDGNYAAKITLGGTNNTARLNGDLGRGYGTFYTRMYFRLDYEDLSVGGATAITYYQDSTASQTNQLGIRQDGSGNYELGVADTTQTGTYAGSDGFIQLDTWYSIETKIYRHDTAGTIDVWLDGNHVLSATGQDTGDTDMDWVMPGIINANSNNIQAFIDNVIVSESYIGTAHYNEAEGAYTVDASSDPWWDRNWTKRRKISFDNAAQSTALTDFPILVKLNSSRIDYSYTQSSGQDLRFVDADGRTVLKHEIEEFDESGSDWVWVRVPQIDASSHGDYIWMYYGNLGASAPPSTHAEETWNDNYVGVWHLRESGDGTFNEFVNSALDENHGHGGGYNRQINGLRFNNVTVPQGATIDDAYVQFTADETGSVTTNLTFYGEDTDDAAIFANGTRNVSNRTKTSASVNWNNVPAWNVEGESGTDQRSPDLTSIIQEIVNRAGWSSANDMVIIVEGSGLRVAESYDGTDAPSLTIDYNTTQSVTRDVSQSWDDVEEDAQGGSIVYDSTDLDLVDEFEPTGSSSNIPSQITGQIGYGQDFDPTDSYDDVINVGAGALELTSSDQITIQAWIQHNITPAWGTSYGIFSLKGYDGGYRLTIPEDGSNNYLNIQIPGSTHTRNSASTISNNVWHQVASTYDGSTVKLFIDGSKDTNELSKTGNLIAPNAQEFAFIGGGDQPADVAWTFPFDGQIDEVRISDTARSDDWIAAQYDSMSDTFNTFGSEEDYTTYAPTALQNAPSIASFDIDGGSNASTLVDDASVNAGDASFTVDSTTGFPDGGGTTTYYAYIEGDKFSYTDTTSTTTFTGIPSTGELSIIGHADNSVVSLMNRHNPYIKVRGWRDVRKPSNVSLEGSTLFEGIDYNSSQKPFSTSYFAQDLTWHSTLESSGAVTSPDVGDAGTVNNLSASEFVAAKYGNGVEINESNEYVSLQMPNNIGSTTGTIEFWYKETTNATLYERFFASDEGADEFNLYRNNSDTSLSLQINSTPGTSWSGIPNVFDGEWHHIRVTYSIDTGGTDDSFYLYVDGVSQGEETTNITAAIDLSGNNLRIGVGADGGSDIGGIIDEFRVYDTVAGPDPIAKGGDTGDSDEYLADTTSDYTFDFNTGTDNRQEYLWLGSDSRFTGVNYQLTTQGTGSSDDFDWEYWDGDSWSVLTGMDLVSGSASFETTTGSFYFDQPYDWNLYSVNGSTDLYFIRGHLEGGTLSDFTESVFYTDILLFQYLSNITGIDQTFVLTSAPIIQSQASIQIDVPHRYRAIMNTGDTSDYLLFYDRAENDTSPDEVLKLWPMHVKEENVDYLLQQDASRRTTIIESSATRIKVRVEGCMDTSGGNACLEDDDNDGSDDVITVTEDYTFTSEGAFVTTMLDAKDDGLTIDNTVQTDYLYTHNVRFNGTVSTAHSETVVYGDGEDEGTTSVSANLDAGDDTYVVLQGNSNYQDIIMGTMRLDGGSAYLSNSTNGSNWYTASGDSNPETIVFIESYTQTIRGMGDSHYFFQFHSQTILDTEAEREATFNDFTNPDYITHATGKTWYDLGVPVANPSGTPVEASPGLKFDGTDDMVRVAQHSDFEMTGDMTIEAWVMFHNVNGGKQAILGNKESGGYSMRLNDDASGSRKIDFTIDNEGATEIYKVYSTNTLAVDDVWYHVAGVRDGTDIKLYINGDYENTTSSTSLGTSDFYFWIGADAQDVSGPPGVDEYHCNCTIDEVRLWNDARTEDELREYMNKEFEENEVDNLLAYWRLNENTGTTAHDETSSNHDGTLGPGSSSYEPDWVSGYVPDHYNEAEGAYTMEMNTPSQALNFDGSADYVSVADDNTLDLSNFTLEVWTNINYENADQYILEKGSDSDTYANYYFWYSGNGSYCGNPDVLCVGFRNSTGSAWKDHDANWTPTIGQWHHLAVTYNGERIKVYADGAEILDEAETDTPLTGNGKLKIGSKRDNGLNFHGSLDDVRIYDTALSQSQIQDSMNGPLVGNEDNLVGYWKFDEGRGQIAHDASNNGNEGTLGANFAVESNDPTWVNGHVGPKLNMVGFDVDGGSNVSTLVNDASVSAGDTSFTVDSTSGFPDGGGNTTYYAYIEGDKFSYTDVDGTQFTGIPATGEFSIIGHADDSVVSLMNRHKPFYKIRNYRDGAAPSEITLEGSALTSGTDYNTDIKPYTTSYFAQDLTWHSTLESDAAVTSPDVGSAGSVGSATSYVAGRYGKAADCNSTSNRSYTFPVSGNFDKAKGAIEFWYRPEFDYGQTINSWILVDNDDAGGSQFLFDYFATIGDLRFQIIQGGNSVTVTTELTATNLWNANDWVHLRIEWDDSASVAEQMKIFVNGVEPSHSDDPSSDDFDSSQLTLATNTYIGSNAAVSVGCDGRIDEFRAYDFNGSGDRAELAKLSEGGDTADSDEYLADTDNDYTFDFNDDDASNRGEYVWIGSDSQFQGMNVVLATDGVDNGTTFTDDFESTGFSNWTSTSTDSGDLSESTDDAYTGTYSLKAVIDDTNELYLRKESLTSSNKASTRFNIKLDSNFSMADDDTMYLSQMRQSGILAFGDLQLTYENSGGEDVFRIWMRCYTDADTDVHIPTYRGDSTTVLKPGAWYMVGYSCQAASGVGANDGVGTLKINGTTVATNTTIDNDTQTSTRSQLDFALIDSGTSGNIYVDDFTYWDGTMDYDWEYWDGDSWSGLTIAGVHGLRIEAFLDDGNFFFDAPADWRPYSVNGSTDLYYIRGHLESGMYSTDPIEDKVKTDILLLQYLSNITSEDQTFVVIPEYLWIWFALAPCLPLVVRRRKRHLGSRQG